MDRIAGDTVVGHSVAFSKLWESICGFGENREIAFSRIIALELERIAIHTGDLSAVCTDIAYQLGSSVFGRLRTPIVNFMQEWCGNRLSQSLIRPGSNQFPFTKELALRLTEVLDKYEPDFVEMSNTLFNLPSALSRFERTGIVTPHDALSIGLVGMTARASGVQRDVRTSHPYGLYQELNHEMITKYQGDVFSRVQIRKEEILQSILYLRQLISALPAHSNTAVQFGVPGQNLFAISMVEGWRGEICHCTITDSKGELIIYKVKDPSFHNWLALALAVRNNEISDFPICNKSFNLSYCGHDL